ncbi:hypothetical protein BD311DRAFT_752136 [Dichomitus squalens]|uniref:Uncharacterized protein n=1 Tax=Dichomitus squalens TaxID=114155 RepID=A0A4Q9MW36_9APHY|nr:hypothetical protein BD311DRAFT_752136 [Dichomitus squalens]
MEGNALPPYSDNRDAARADLKQKFTALVHDQRDIQEIFRSIAIELRATPEIGDRHPLVQEWEALRERHKHTYNKSRHSASWCARYLENFAKTLIPLSISKDIPEKKEMIKLFLEAIGAHMEAAKENMESFSELARDVEAFPHRVASAVRTANSPWTGSSGFFVKIEEWVEQLWNSIWQMIAGLFSKLAHVLDAALARLQRISISFCGASVDVWFQRDYDYIRQDLIEKQRERELQDNYNILHDKLSGFEGAWHLVHVKCSQLLADLELAQSFTETNVPRAVDTNLAAAAAAALDDSLIECLRAYSKGESPISS